MARIFTPPDMEFDRTIPKVFVRNCDWSDEKIREVLDVLSEDKNYDVYLYNDSMNDIQWAEGIRTQSAQVFDCRHYTSEDPVVWMKRVDDGF